MPSPPLNLGRLKRKYVPMRLGYSLLTVCNGNSGKAGRVVSQGAQKGVFVFGAGDKGGDDSGTECEVVLEGKIVQQVGEVTFPPEPERIRFLHRVHGRLLMAEAWAGESLREWYWRITGRKVGALYDGYFTTKGGRVLHTETLAKDLGLWSGQEVVLQGRLGGGGEEGGSRDNQHTTNTRPTHDQRTTNTQPTTTNTQPTTTVNNNNQQQPTTTTNTNNQQQHSVAILIHVVDYFCILRLGWRSLLATLLEVRWTSPVCLISIC